MHYQHFSVEEREVVQDGLWRHQSIRTIAQGLHRSPSSIAREIKRNLPPEQQRYTPRLAHERALTKRSSRGRTERLKNQRIRQYVVTHLKQRWSPEQIAGRMKGDIDEHISHEAIYQFIYAHIYRHGYGYVKPGQEDLRPYLRRQRKRRIHRGSRRCQRTDKPIDHSIETRPAVVAARARLGDWEGDTVESGHHKPGINTLVERSSGLVLITKLSAKTSAATVEAMIKRFQSVPLALKHTVTLDNGSENSNWRAIEAHTGLTCYFAHPYSSWERGTNENTNGLIRDYFSKKTDFTRIAEAELAFVEHALNTRPRKRLQWKTPLEVISVALES